FTLILAAVTFLGVGCKKIKTTRNSNTVTITTPGGDNVQPKPTAGPGGNAGFRVTPNHNGIDIDSCMVYIKYDAAVVPVDGKYDDSVWCKMMDGKPVGSFDGLLPGNYYLLAKGWDLIRSQKVKGGLPFIILEENAGTTHSFVLPIHQYE
ncbi:MAG: hypothetical protein H6550_16610, partial [Chitinophagales bacterium]|nr:hypothetical protein [Chitinophagales bacterium]